jgi:hypothetical protein
VQYALYIYISDALRPLPVGVNDAHRRTTAIDYRRPDWPGLTVIDRDQPVSIWIDRERP